MRRATAEERSLARELRSQGRTLGQIAYRLGYSKTTILRWLDPEYRERERRRSLEYRYENRERINAYNRERMRHRFAGTCPVCGNVTHRQVKRCRACRTNDRSWLYRELETLWNDGKTVAEIAATVGRTERSVEKHIRRMRAMGRDIPRRRRTR